MCHTYVNDALSNPVPLPGTNPKRGLRYAYLFVPEFVRVGHEHTDIEFISLLFVEAGGVTRTCYMRDPMTVARMWVQQQSIAIGDLRQIHANHMTPQPEPTPLRIRIPPDDLYS